MFKMLKYLFTGRQQIALTWNLLRDGRVPKWKKLIPFLPLLYILSPVNLMTLAIPLIGPIEDVAMVLMAMKLFEKSVDPQLVASYQPQAAAA